MESESREFPVSFPRPGSSAVSSRPALGSSLLLTLLPEAPTYQHQTSDVGGLEVGSGRCRGQGLDELDPEGSLSSTYEKVSSCPFTGGLEEGGHSPCRSGSPLLAQLCPHLMRCLLSRNLACRCPVSQVDLESILQSPGGSPHHLSEGTALRAFSLHCRLSIHLQHEVRPPAWVRTRGELAQRLCD